MAKKTESEAVNKFLDVLFQPGNITDEKIIRDVNNLNIHEEADFKGLIVIALRKLAVNTFLKNKIKGDTK